MTEIGPYSNYHLTVRLELANTPGRMLLAAGLSHLVGCEPAERISPPA